MKNQRKEAQLVKYNTINQKKVPVGSTKNGVLANCVNKPSAKSCVLPNCVNKPSFNKWSVLHGHAKIFLLNKSTNWL